MKKTCSRGHVFNKTSACPVCPKCWPGYYKKQLAKTDIPKTSAPAFRALEAKKITKLAHLTKFTEKEILSLHGMGPKAFGILKKALKAQGKSFKK